MENKQPKVSIGMLVWNGEDYIALALDSLLAQDFKDFEIILSDNASTDDTEKICNEYVKKDKRIIYIKQKENIGACKNFNFVLDKAKSEYFMWASYDDLWEPSYITEMVKVLDNNKSVVVAFCSSDNIDKNGKLIQTHYCPTGTGIFSQGIIFKRAYTFLIKGMPLPFIYGLMRTHIVKKIGGFGGHSDKKNELNRGRFAIDIIAEFRLIFEGDLYIVDKVLFHHRFTRKDTDIYLKSHKKLTTLSFLLLKVLRMFFNVQAYFVEIRRIILESKLSPYQKYFLFCVTWVAELKDILIRIFYYFNSLSKFICSFNYRKQYLDDAIKYNPASKNENGSSPILEKLGVKN